MSGGGGGGVDTNVPPRCAESSELIGRAQRATLRRKAAVFTSP